MEDYEKLGAFYLGKVSLDGAVTDELLLYDAKDLTTHAVIVGMTGSGKTGLAATLLEEAAIDGIPALVIDPKGDLGNLLLQFPDLAPADFEPWVDPAEAAASGASVAEYAHAVAERWRQGLAQWGQSGARIARLRAAAVPTLYTPGSTTGTPVSALRSFAAPAATVRADGDAFREAMQAAVSSVLALIGVEADPIRSREYILLANILQTRWSAGRDVELASLVRDIQAPPFDCIGVLDLESFFPARDRAALALALNGLLASPGFSAWLQGTPLHLPSLLWTEQGKPRLSIFSIGHLSDSERMFFVTLLLNEVVAWMRTQTGTSSLRAVIYMDEVFGFFPPTANPPAKVPMLTLLKQARAFGLGVVLATQNPVDLDYKGLSNAGTWFIGRLQTERDVARVLDGLEGASTAAGGGFDRQAMAATLAGLGKRVFLMHNVHESEPVLFHTRWALSYLRGPLARAQIKLLTERAHGSPEVPPDPAPPHVSPIPVSAVGGASAARPTLDLELPQRFGVTRALTAGAVLRPALFARVKLHFVKSTLGIDEWRTVQVLAPLGADPEVTLWHAARVVERDELDVEDEFPEVVSYSELPVGLRRLRSTTTLQKELARHLYESQALSLWSCVEPKLTSAPGESEGEFRSRLLQALREARDLAREKLRQRFAPQLARLQERLRSAEERVARERSQYGQQQAQTAVSFGATILGALFGRKLASASNLGRVASSARGVSRTARERADVARAEDNRETLQSQLAELESEFREAAERASELPSAESFVLQRVEVPVRKADIAVEYLALVWGYEWPSS
ncbi:MAG: DUF87 domain-containing protein [Planctomycetota bacterium]